MADNRQAAGEWAILSENRVYRFVTFFLLYFGQGLPLGVSTIGMTAWMAANGAADVDVALVAATAYLPWSFKFLPAFVMDRYAWLPMGRRRAWLIAAQALMLGAFALAAFKAPSVDDVELLVTITFLIGAGSAIQDVAVDGLAVDIVPAREQGTACSFMFGGQATGRAVAGAGSGTLFFLYGSQVTFLAFLPVILLITAYAIFMKERPGERRLPWSEGSAHPVNIERQAENWGQLLVTAIKLMVRRDSILLISASALQRTAEGMLLPLMPILAVTFLMWNEAQYSQTASTSDLLMALTAIAVGSFLTLRLGAKWAAMLIFCCQALLCSFIWLGQGAWTTPAIFIVMLATYQLLVVLSSICTSPMRMQLSDPRAAAAQFTLYNSLGNLPVSFGSATMFVMLGGSANLPMVMGVAIALLLMATLILSLVRVGLRQQAEAPVPAVN